MKKKLEKDIQREICDWLNSSGVFFWRQNTTPIFDTRKGVFRAMAKYTYRGLPDILILKDGKLIGLEVKVPGYWKRTDEQILMKDLFMNNGGFYTIVTSLPEAQEYMSRFQ